MKSLIVPFDTNGNEIRPDIAEKNVKYYCPDCKGESIFRKGKKKTPHFAHKVNPIKCNFLVETEEHLRAKWKIVEMIKNNIQAKVVRSCSVCGAKIIQPLFQKVSKVNLEYYLAPYYLRCCLFR